MENTFGRRKVIMGFTEASLEQAIIELLEEEGYPHVCGTSIQREPSDVLIIEDLITFLQNQYASENITEGEIKTVIRQLEVFSASDLYDSNKAIMKMISDGFLLKREDRNKKRPLYSAY